MELTHNKVHFVAAVATAKTDRPKRLQLDCYQSLRGLEATCYVNACWWLAVPRYRMDSLASRPSAKRAVRIWPLSLVVAE